MQALANHASYFERTYSWTNGRRPLSASAVPGSEERRRSSGVTEDKPERSFLFFADWEDDLADPV